MVSLAVVRAMEPPRTIIAGLPRNHDTDSLPQTGLWFPRLPPPSLYLNENSFPVGLRFADEFRPLTWTYFGGFKGIYLKTSSNSDSTLVKTYKELNLGTIMTAFRTVVILLVATNALGPHVIVTTSLTLMDLVVS